MQNIQVKIPLDNTEIKGLPLSEAVLKKYASARLKTGADHIGKILIRKQSFDFRNREHPLLVYDLDVFKKSEYKSGSVNGTATVMTDSILASLLSGIDRNKNSGNSPVIAGFGPAGMFCGLVLAYLGYRPVILERGKSIEGRTDDVENFWENGNLCTESNVQFGEGGAGAFSDGKLTTLIKEKNGICRFILELFAANGAPESVLYDSKPHIGTDILRNVVKNIREKIISYGGTVLFETKLHDIVTKNNELKAIVIKDRLGYFSEIECSDLFLATGHSARDTYFMLDSHCVSMERKSISLGVRIEFPQLLLNENQYGKFAGLIGQYHPADYKLSCHTSSGRGVYTFCMCPGGYVVNSSSEKEHVVTNGMSYNERGSNTSNSALLVSVYPEDYEPFSRFSEDPLAGILFQRNTENKAYIAGGRDYSVPFSTAGLFLGRGYSHQNDFSGFEGCHKGKFRQGDLRDFLPGYVCDSLKEAMTEMSGKIPYFTSENTILSGPESRSSSPVRIIRDENTLNSSVKGIIPLGEGAGYAGGIMSAGCDGIKGAISFANSFD